MNVKVGTGPDSWGVWFADDPKQIPWHRFLDEVVEAGYEWIELGPYGYLPTDLPTLRAELEQRDLKVSGAMTLANLEEPSAWPEVERQVLGAGALVAGLGGKFMVLIDGLHTDWFTGERLEPEFLDDAAWQRLIDTTHKVADIVRQQFGLRLAFHSSPDTHVAYEDQIEALLEQTDPERVSLGLDIGHFAYRDIDPVDFIRRHQERISYLHFKSVDKDIQRRVAAEDIPFAQAVQMGIFCEPSKGIVDYPALRDVLNEIDFDGYAIIEQDMYPAPFDKPLPIAKRTRAYLREIGIG